MIRPTLSFCLCALAGTVAAADLQGVDAIANLSIEQLSEIVVTSVARQETRLGSAPAALFIISATDIARSGARTLPEALRLAPNLQVARDSANKYAVTARGFNLVLQNKLLVLIDGRSVYSPLFSGVFWDAQDVVMADIARIEVISGPGATIWGANAVNGVINIITKAAGQTQGGIATASVGAHERSATLRYGGKLANGGHYRAYFKSGETDDSVNAAGTRVPSGWRRNQAGFRTDWERGDASITVSGDAYAGKVGQPRFDDIAIAGANLLGRYSSRPSERSQLRLQVIADHTERNQPGAIIEHLDTLDLELQHGITLGERHRLVWGGGYRHSWDRIVNGRVLGFLPTSLNMHWANVFAQDEITLSPAWRLTAGLKLEHNNYTGVEVLPNLRLAYEPSAGRLLWSSLSRTVRVPSRIDRDFYFPINPPSVAGVPRYTLAGGPDFVSETADVAEIGYRAQPTPALSYSVTAFYADYDKLRTVEPLAPGSWVLRNLGQATSRGVELWGQWQVRPNWRLHGGAVVQRLRSGLKPGSLDNSGTTGLITSDPEARYLLRSSHDLSDTMQFDFTFRHVGGLQRPAVPSYRELDAQFLWSPRPHIDIALTGQNLLHDSHPEFGLAPARSVFERTVQLSAMVRF